MMLRNTLALLALYLILLAGLAFLIEDELRASTRELVQDKAQWVRDEVAATLRNSGLRHWLDQERPRDQYLTKIIANVKQSSGNLAGIEVVNAQGKVVASDAKAAKGTSRQPPDTVFKGNLKPVLLTSFKHRFQADRHALAIPLVNQDRLLGYVSIPLNDRHIAALHHDVYLTLLLAAIAGLGAITALGALLQVRLKRADKNLAVLMETMAVGDCAPPTGGEREFAEARGAASRLGDELKTARALAASTQNKLDAMGNAVEVGVILIGSEGACEYINQTAKELLGGDRPEEFEARFSILRAALTEAIDKWRLSGGAARVADVEVADAAGAIRRLRIRLQCVSVCDDRDCLLIVKDRALIDATDADLRAATHARSLSRLYAATAHDIRAPLNSISLQLEMLKHGVGKTDPRARKRQQHHVEVLNRELMRLNRLLQFVFDNAAPKAEARDAIDFKRLIGELGALLTPQARHQRVSLEVALPSQPVQVFGDAGQLNQALLNVALNALDAVTEGGRIEIKLRTHASAALLTICDNGAGISDALQASIFNQHFTTKNSGTGIGLYVARAVAEAHDGEIRVESKPGAGACFTISLPLHRADRSARLVPESINEPDG